MNCWNTLHKPGKDRNFVIFERACTPQTMLAVCERACRCPGLMTWPRCSMPFVKSSHPFDLSATPSSSWYDMNCCMSSTFLWELWKYHNTIEVRSTNCHLTMDNMISIALWNVLGALFIPNGIQVAPRQAQWWWHVSHFLGSPDLSSGVFWNELSKLLSAIELVVLGAVISLALKFVTMSFVYFSWSNSSKKGQSSWKAPSVWLPCLVFGSRLEPIPGDSLANNDLASPVSECCVDKDEGGVLFRLVDQWSFAAVC